MVGDEPALDRVTSRSCLLSALGGVLAALGFAGPRVWPLALVAFVPLLAALELDRTATNRRVLLLGLLFGTVAWAGGCYWIVATLHRFAALPWVASLAIATLVWIHHGGLFAAFGWLWWRARRRGATAAVAAGAAFAAAELVYPRLWPGYYAASFHEVPIVLQIAELGGPLLVGALCLAVNGALYDLAVGRQNVAARPAALVVAVCVLATLAYGAVRIAQIDASVRDAPRLRVGIVQPNMEGFAKWRDLRDGQQRLLEATAALERSVHPDLVVWPENAWAAGLPADVTRVPPAVTAGTQTALLFGTTTRTRDGHGFNRVHLVDERGDVLGTYDKVNLFPFGEYLPWEERLPWLRTLSPASGRVRPGRGVPMLPFRGWRIAALVCYEDALPGFVRRVTREGTPHLLVNLTNDAWFGASSEPWIHLALSQLRAIEQRRYLVRATNTGVSAVVDPVGRVVAHAGSFTRETIDADVAMLTGITPYQRCGDWPGWIGLAAILWLAFARRDGAGGAS